MSKIIGSVTQKGGNGKSTCTLNLSFELGQLGLKVCMVDLDAQASLSKNVLGEEELPGYQGVEDLFLDEKLNPNDSVVSTSMKNVSIIPSHSSLAGVPSKLIYDGNGFFALGDILDKLTGFDYIFIDTPGSLEFLTMSCIIASHHLIIPIYPAFYSMLAINDLMKSIERMKKNYGAKASITGVLVTMMDRRANLYHEIEAEVREFFKEKAFQTSTTRTVKSEEATVKGIGVSGLYPNCNLAKEYKALTQELLSRTGG